MISQITPAGLRPARRARSTAASVWPVRSSTPPGLAFSGKTCPGCTRSRGRGARVDRDLDRARAVVRGDAGRDALARLDRDREGGLERRLVLRRHQVEAELVAAVRREREADQPAPLLGHEVDRLGRRELGGHREVALVLAVLVVADDDHLARADVLDRLLDGRERRPSSPDCSSRHQLLDVFREHVDLEVDGRPGAALPSVVRSSVSGISETVRRLVVDRGDGEADAVDRDRALLDDVAQQIGVAAIVAMRARSRPRSTAATRAEAVDVALHDVAAEAVVRRAAAARGSRGRPASTRAERGAAQRLVHDVGARTRASSGSHAPSGRRR